MEKFKVLIVAKTRRGAGACIGAITSEGQSVRLEAANAATDEYAGLDYTVGEVWEVEGARPDHTIPPHVENLVVFARHRLGVKHDFIPLIERHMPPKTGGLDLLYEGLANHTSTGALYITQRTGVPSYSTCFWRPDRPLQLDTNGKRVRYRYPTAGGGRTLTYVGFQEPLESIEAGTLLRVSLAHWWHPEETPDAEPRCFVQLSGWFLPNDAQRSPPARSSQSGQPCRPRDPTPTDLSAACRLLKDVFGFDSFRPLQAEIIENLLDGQDTLAILPTGGGKSLCYQLPALLWEGLTVVVSPLIALMQDQVDALRQLDLPAVYLNSTVDYASYVATAERIKAGAIKLLYVAPETLLRPETLVLLDRCRVACLTIDEAHCISQWGHDFRQEYRQLLPVRRRFAQAVCLALTATAAPRVRRDIGQMLGIDQAHTFIANFDRQNLHLAAQPRTDGLRQLQAFLAAHPRQAGIVYCSTRRQVDILVKQLAAYGVEALPYHAGLDDATRSHNQRAFVRDQVALMVATVAFGMGINKSNVRFIVHYSLPPSLEHYYQEVGRAGRDSLPADCLLLYSRHDVQLHLKFVEEGAEGERPGRQARLQAMLRFAQTGECRRKPLLAYFGETFTPATCGRCDNCRRGEDAHEKTDVTEAARRFLTCVQQTGERFGISHIVGVLRGSQARKVQQFQHQRLSSHGAGKDLPEKQWKALAQHFIQQGLLAQDMEHGTLTLVSKGRAVLRGQEPVWVVLESESQQSRQADAHLVHDALLFETLRTLRRELADAANVPPYIVFSDRALVEMATYFPHSPQRLLSINGVGQAKFARYGEQFLAAIRAHCTAHGLEEKPLLTAAPAVGRVATGRTVTSGIRRYVEVGDLFGAGLTIAALQEMYGVKLGTIVNHLYAYVCTGGRIDATRVLASSTLSPAQLATVNQLLAELGHERLAPLFEQFQGTIPYDELHLLRLAYVAQRRDSKCPNHDPPFTLDTP